MGYITVLLYTLLNIMYILNIVNTTTDFKATLNTTVTPKIRWPYATRQLHTVHMMLLR